MDVSVATTENMEKNHPNPERMGGSPAVGSQVKRLPKTPGARLVWLAPKAGKVRDRTVSCTHISQVSLAKIQHFGFIWGKKKTNKSSVHPAASAASAA